MKNNNDIDFDIVYLDDDADLTQSNSSKAANMDSNKADSSSYKKQSKKRNRKRSMPSIPFGKIVKGIGKTAWKIAGTLFRLTTFALIGYILYLLFTHFWVGKNVYGNITKIVSDKNYILAAYCGMALIILFYEFISLLWSFSTQKTKEKNRMRKLDTGRGFCSFILIYAGSLAAKLFAYMIPSSPSFLKGIEGALNIYGSLESILFPICIAGVICSLLRKFIFH